MKNNTHIILFILVLALSTTYTCSATAQDGNFKYPIDVIEKLLTYDPVEFRIPRDIRVKGDKTKRAVLMREDEFYVFIKLKKSERGGDAPNNKPRFEIAAYKLQKLFLDQADYVVPPTAARGFPLEMCKKLDKKAKPTFKNSSSVFYAMQYWLNNVTADDVYDKKRFESDSRYAYHLGNFNIFSYLIKHYDSNKGNILISTDPENPRIFSVDNGIAFGDTYGDRGHKWEKIRLKRLPRTTIDRLRNITKDDLIANLGVVAQYKIENEQIVPTEPGKNLNKKIGVRQKNGIIQLGLTAREIDKIHGRLKKLIRQIDTGKIRVF